MPEGNKIDLSGDGSVLKEIMEEGKGRRHTPDALYPCTTRVA